MRFSLLATVLSIALTAAALPSAQGALNNNRVMPGGESRRRMRRLLALCHVLQWASHGHTPRPKLLHNLRLESRGSSDQGEVRVDQYIPMYAQGSRGDQCILTVRSYLTQLNLARL
jgi:hypothetical protein